MSSPHLLPSSRMLSSYTTLDVTTSNSNSIATGGGSNGGSGSADAQFVDNLKEVDEFLSLTGAALLTWRVVWNQANTGPTSGGKGNTTTTHIDDLLSKELLQMSIQDQNTIYEEIHGVQTLVPTETLSLIQTALAQLATKLDLVYQAHKVVYKRSQQHRKSCTAEFRLQFLRCELFDAKKAAIRIVHFLDLLLEVFGEYALQGLIQMTDFNRDKMQIFRLGLQQLLPY